MTALIKRLIPGLMLCMIMAPVSACSQQTVAGLMEEYLWQNRVLLVFTPAVDDADYTAQKKMFRNTGAEFDERDLVTWEFIYGERVMVDGATKPHLATQRFYTAYDMDPASFGVILLGKDGTEKLREGVPVAAAELFGLIDSMPMRQNEMNEE